MRRSMLGAVALAACASFALTQHGPPAHANPSCRQLTLVAPVGMKDLIAGNSVRQQWSVEAALDGAAPNECRCCEYLQEIKGSLSINGTKITLRRQKDDPVKPGLIHDIYLDEDEYHEDATFLGGIPRRYGHRAEARTTEEKYTTGGSGPSAASSNRSRGCAYRNEGQMGWRNGTPGNTYGMDLRLRASMRSAGGECGECASCQSKEWSVKLTRSIPEDAPFLPVTWALALAAGVLGLFALQRLAVRRRRLG